MKWIGQHIWSFVSRFRSAVYLESITEHVDYDAETLVKDNTTGLVQWTKRANAGTVHLYVKAAEDLKKGHAVYASGAVGNSQAIEVSKYIANNTIDERRFLGIIESDIDTGEFGYVITVGTLKGIDATGAGITEVIGETWLEGDILFASDSYAGELTKVQPSAPNQVIPCAFVLKNNSNGTIAIRAYDLGYHINELHDIEVTSPTEGQVLTYDETLGIWENTSSADKHYTHSQDISASQWVIDHNLNKYPSVQVIDSAGSFCIGKVTHNSVNQLTLDFNASFTGKAYMN